VAVDGLDRTQRSGRLTWRDTQVLAQLAKERPAVLAPTGATTLAGQVLRMNGQPLAQVTLSIGQARTQTDDNGEFVLSGVQAGLQVLQIDGRSANRSDALGRPVRYGVFHYQAQIQPGRANHLPFVVWMPKLDTRHAIRIDSPTRSEVTLKHPLIPGLEITLPAGTVVRDVDGRIVTEVTITPLPVDQTPFPMPYFGVPVYFTLQPGGAVLQGIDGKPRAATVRYPNYTDFGSSAPMRLFDYDPGRSGAPGRGWYVYADARVSATDPRRLESNSPFQIYQFTATSVSSGGLPAPGASPDGCGGGDSGEGGSGAGWTQEADAGTAACTADPVDLTTGHFSHTERDLWLPDVMPIDIRRTYRTLDNDGAGRPVLRSFGVGVTHFYEAYLVIGTVAYSEMRLVLPNGRDVVFSGVPSGTYNQVYVNNDASGEFRGATLQVVSGYFVVTFRDGRQWGFSKLGARLMWLDDRNGNRTHIERLGNNAYVSRITSPSGRWVEISYGGNGLVSQIQDPLGRTFKYAYDGGQRLTEVTDPNDKKRIYVWDTANNRIESIRDPNGHTMVFNGYDAAGRVSRQTLADGSTFGLVYGTDAATGRVVQVDVTDRRGTVRRAEFDAAGHLIRNTRALGLAEQQVTTYEVLNGLTLSVTDALGRKTGFGYDAVGNTTRITRLEGTSQAVTTRMTYEPVFNQLLTLTDPNEHTTTLAYDDNGHLIRVADALGHAVRFTRDPLGRVRTVIDPLDKVTTLGYDGADLSRVTDPLDRQVQYLTDAAGRVMATVDPQGNRTVQDWDGLNRLRSITDALGGITRFSYDDNGHLLSHSDPANHTTHYTYNGLGKVQGMLDALGKEERSLYEPGGQIRQRIDRKGQLSTVSYDALGRVKTVSFGASEASPTAYRSRIELTWDKANRLERIVDKTCADPQGSPDCASVAASSTIVRTYDGLDRLESETTAQGEVAYTYDAAGRRASMTVKNGPAGNQTVQPTITYSYDDADRLTGIKQAAGGINGGQAQNIVLAYDDANRRTRTTLANGSTVAYTYDNGGQLTAMIYKKADGTLIGDQRYEYDANGRRISAAGSLARVNLPGAAVLDASYDANNRMLAWRGQSYSYDDNGNMVGDGVNSYQWDERNQLRSIGNGAASVASFQYDSRGRRTGKTIGSTSTGFLYDGDNFVQELLGVGSGAGVKAHLITGGVDETFLRMEGNDGATKHSVLSDGNNNTVRLLDGNQAKVVDYTYEPYGATTADAANGNTQQYTGRENDNPGDANGLYYYRARYYMPGCARFISEDPIGWASGQVNNYAYVWGDPIAMVDPYGLLGAADLPSIPQPVLDYVTGAADAASLGFGPMARDALGIDGGVNRCSGGYSAGQWTSFAFGAGRMAYAGIAKVGAAVAADGAGAMAFRNGLKRVMRGPLAGSNFRIKTYEDLLAKYGSDEAIQAAAGRTNPAVNAVGSNMTIGSAVGISGARCP